LVSGGASAAPALRLSFTVIPLKEGRVENQR